MELINNKENEFSNNNCILIDLMLLKADESDFTEEEYDTILDEIIEFIETKRLVIYANTQLINSNEK